MNGERWYKLQASRTVNQAIGRVIRHIRDYGAVFLCDQRYASSSTIGISKWMRDRKRVFDAKNIGRLEPETINFFRDNLARFGRGGTPILVPEVIKKDVIPEVAAAQKLVRKKERKREKKRQRKERTKKRPREEGKGLASAAAAAAAAAAAFASSSSLLPLPLPLPLGQGPSAAPRRRSP